MRIVAFPFHDWQKGIREGFRTRDGHLMKEFARRTDVERMVVVNRPTSLIERRIRRHAPVPGDRIAARRLGRFHARLTAVDAKVLILEVDTPEILHPLLERRGWWFRVFGMPAVQDLIRWGIAAAEAEAAPVIVWMPTPHRAIEQLRPGRFVFDSLDNWLIHPVLRRQAEAAARGYAALLPMADAVIAAAPRSAEVLSRWHSGVQVIPNGVDSSDWQLDRARPADLPSGTVVGYAGKLAHRIDTELVRDVALQRPDLEFVFVGPILEEGPIKPLRSIPNVHLVGDRHYELLPAYVRHFDVAWIPHRVGEGESGGDPIKLYEYWAAGRPVVTTPIDGMESWAASLAIASDADGIVAGIEQMLSAPVVPQVPPDREWSAIADRMIAALRG
jgi:glycosyltransferase involved in cell wall biosynthesis